jgi:hypothetical protein
MRRKNTGKKKKRKRKESDMEKGFGQRKTYRYWKK